MRFINQPSQWKLKATCGQKFAPPPAQYKITKSLICQQPKVSINYAAASQEIASSNNDVLKERGDI